MKLDELIKEIQDLKEKERQLNGIKDFLKDLIDGVEENTRKEKTEKIRKFVNDVLGDDDCE